MATDYTYLYEEYPEVISADQLYRICHISKRKAKWLLCQTQQPPHMVCSKDFADSSLCSEIQNGKGSAAVS